MIRVHYHTISGEHTINHSSTYYSYDDFTRTFDESRYAIDMFIIDSPESEEDFQKFLPPLGTYFPETECLTIQYRLGRITLELPKLHRNTSRFVTYGITISNIDDILPSELRRLELVHGTYMSTPTLPQNLVSLNMRDNEIFALPHQFPETLKMLVLSNNHIQSLPSLPEGLETLYVDYNGLRSLPQMPPSIVSLYVQSNGIYHLPTLPHSLVEFNCEDNCIGRFPVNFPEYLEVLQTEGNPDDVPPETFERLEYLERHT